MAASQMNHLELYLTSAYGASKPIVHRQRVEDAIAKPDLVDVDRHG